MNERMYELINEAFIGTTDGKLSELNTVANVEKLAELIVRECAGLCSTHEMADEPFGVKSYRKGHHFDVMIRQHFGVE